MADGANPDYRTNIVSATLFAKKTTLNPTVQMERIKALQKSTVKYPMRSVDCKVYSIPAGVRSHTHENLFLGTLPKHLVLCCTDNDAYNGSYDKNPFHAKNNAISFHAVYLDGRHIPSKPFQPNFEDDLFIRSYMSLFSSTDKMWQDEGNGLSRSDFLHGYTYFGFDLTSDQCDGACFHLVQKGNLCVELHFRDALSNIIAYAEFESVLGIDKSRNIIYDYRDGQPADRQTTGDGPAHQIDLSRCRTQRRTAYDDRRFACGLRVQHRRRWRTWRTLDSAVPEWRWRRQLLLLVRPAATTRNVPHLHERTLFRVDS